MSVRAAQAALAGAVVALAGAAQAGAVVALAARAALTGAVVALAGAAQAGPEQGREITDTAAPATVGACGPLDAASAIAEPWSHYSRTYAGGAIRLVAADRVEPACGALVLLVLMPGAEDEGPQYRLCQAVYSDPGARYGWGDVDLGAATARYDPSRGLTVAVPVHDCADAPGSFRRVTITINRARATVTVP
ncbi:MAG: hypothetical protein AAF677_16255 [Pseudomonadota bacterium]